jgi:hypothetical protein
VCVVVCLSEWVLHIWRRVVLCSAADGAAGGRLLEGALARVAAPPNRRRPLCAWEDGWHDELGLHNPTSCLFISVYGDEIATMESVQCVFGTVAGIACRASSPPVVTAGCGL